MKENHSVYKQHGDWGFQNWEVDTKATSRPVDYRTADGRARTSEGH